MDKPTKIKFLTKGYFQKSSFFLYPLLKIPKRVLPVETYIYCNLDIDKDKPVILCRYNKFTTPTEGEYEKEHLSGNPLFLNYYELIDGTCVYIFEFIEPKHKESWDLFIQGKYSEFPALCKRDIVSFYKKGTRTYDSIYSYLYPTDYYEDYSTLLNVHIDILKAGKELTDKPNIEKETLTTHIKKLDLSSIM